MYTTIVTPEILSDHLNDPRWIIIDCRFDLNNTSWGEEEYLKEHIPGAVYAHLNRDLSAPVTPLTGRHPLPTPVEMDNVFSQLGIENDYQVIVYDQAGGASAAVRLWWMLRIMGHQAVALLTGGITLWKARQFPTQSGLEKRALANFKGVFQESAVASAEEVDRLRLNPAYRLIDARNPIRFSGKEEPIDPVAGHIPGAVNRFHENNLQSDGTLLPAETLRDQFLRLLDGVSPQNTIVYCGSGVTSCHLILAMQIAGLPGAKLYAGSWSEWIRNPKHPVAVSPV